MSPIKKPRGRPRVHPSGMKPVPSKTKSSAYKKTSQLHMRLDKLETDTFRRLGGIQWLRGFLIETRVREQLIREQSEKDSA